MVKIPMKARLLVSFVVLALLPALAVLTAMAYASPPDPAWVSGFFDDGDQDDVVVLVTSTGATVDPFPLDQEWTAPAPADPVSPAETPSTPTRALVCRTPRAPPLV